MSSAGGYENRPNSFNAAAQGDWLLPTPQVESSEHVLATMQAALQGIVLAGRFPAEPDLTVAVPSYSHPSLPLNPSDGFGSFSIESAVILHHLTDILLVPDGFCRYQTNPGLKDPNYARSIANEISTQVHSPVNTPVVQKEANKIYKSPERRLVVATSMARLGVAVIHKHGADDFRNMLEQGNLKEQDFPDAQETPPRLWRAFTADLEAMGVITLPSQGGDLSPVKSGFFSRLASRALGR